MINETLFINLIQAVVKSKLFILFFLITNFSYSCSYAKSKDESQKIQLGIDNLIANNFADIKNKKVALFTNFSGRNVDGILTAEILSKQKGFTLKYFFSPEHGFYGENHAGEKVENNEVFGIPIISLYGSLRRPPLNILQELDVVLIDIQDIGIRSYTFLSSVNYMLTACAEAGIKAIVLDRPNPIGGNIVDGNITEKGCETFMSLIPVPYIHGLTLGEISLMMNEEGWLKNTEGKAMKCDVSVIKMSNWKRYMRWEDCDLLWFPTSPQIPTPDAIRGAAMFGIFGELSIFSIGIGTSMPFQYLGTPAMKVNKVYENINKHNFFGTLIQVSHFKPFYGKFANTSCKGFIFKFPPSQNFAPYTTGIKIMLEVKKIHPELFMPEIVMESRRKMFEKVTGSNQLFNKIFSDATDEEILEVATQGLADFLIKREKYLLYPNE